MALTARPKRQKTKTKTKDKRQCPMSLSDVFLLARGTILQLPNKKEERTEGDTGRWPLPPDPKDKRQRQRQKTKDNVRCLCPMSSSWLGGPSFSCQTKKKREQRVTHGDGPYRQTQKTKDKDKDKRQKTMSDIFEGCLQLGRGDLRGRRKKK